MAVGPGKYDDLCTRVREETKAKMALLVLVEGERGSGFSVQVEDGSLALMRALPDMLEFMASQIRKDGVR